MRFLLSVGLLAIVVGCSGAGHKHASPAAPPAPRLRTLLLRTTPAPGSLAVSRCPKHPFTTLDLEVCSERRLLALDARLNSRVRIVWSRLLDATGRRTFASGEKAWSTYVNDECTSRSLAWLDPASPHQYAGGSEAPVVYGACEEELAAAHLHELTETAAQLGPH
jgi:uncharacterized protein YecT (DUF1311 family)